MEDKMKIYKAFFDGHWLGGVIILFATSQEDAFEKVKVMLDEENIGKDFSIKDVKEFDIARDGNVIHVNNGDY